MNSPQLTFSTLYPVRLLFWVCENPGQVRNPEKSEPVIHAWIEYISNVYVRNFILIHYVQLYHPYLDKLNLYHPQSTLHNLFFICIDVGISFISSLNLFAFNNYMLLKFDWFDWRQPIDKEQNNPDTQKQ